MSNADRDPSNLTGVWQGFYAYSGERRVPFTATLIETASHVSGSTHETCATRGRGTTTVLFALIDGSRRGSTLRFAKQYDGSGGWDHTVAYEGAVNGDATEIEGTWRVNGGISGRFVMTRPRGTTIAVERRRLAKV
jgi:hypothetical protein